MFNLIRRISHSVIPRPDRPWEEDPTSNAPNTRRKRRLSSVERDADADEEHTRKKKVRSESASPSVADDTPLSSEPRAETPAVKEVTKGVEDVDLADEQPDDPPDDPILAPESVPLPEGNDKELDEPASEDILGASRSPLEKEAPPHTDGKDADADSGPAQEATEAAIPSTEPEEEPKETIPAELATSHSSDSQKIED